MPTIKVAKTAGFCFGVDRAMKLVNEQLEKGIKVATLGPLIHNKDVTDNLTRRGVRIIESPAEAKQDETVIIRSHGVGAEVYRQLGELGINYVDATCPYVLRIHQIVKNCEKEEKTILIAGNKDHPEVIGIVGNCQKSVTVFANYDDLLDFSLKNQKNDEKKVAILAQTTYNKVMWEKCITLADSIFRNVERFDTICASTSDRQAEAERLSNECDMTVVIGGKHSSNTAKLYEICRRNGRCCHIENADGLTEIDFSNVNSIGITAGASTPAYIIKEVETQMTEILENMDEDFNFEEALNATFKKIYTGNRVKGYITSVNNNEAIVDIGTKHTGYIPMDELSDDSSLKPCDVVNVGDEVDLIVVKINDAEGIVTLSKKQVDAKLGFEKVMNAKDDGTILDGVVTNVIKGGILVLSNGTKVFIPASQATARKDDKLEDLLKKEVKFKVIEVNEQRGKAVGSIRAVASAEKEAAKAKFWENVEIGSVFKGEVKSLTNYGAFVDLGGIDGMVHKTELSWNRIKHPSEVVNVGDVIEVYVKELDKDANRISLGYKKTEDDPWTIFISKFHEGDVVTAKVVSITPFGAFANIVDGIDGLIHISQIADRRVNKIEEVLTIGQDVEAQITEIDNEKKRVSLSMRALIETAPAEDDAPSVEEAPSEEAAE